MFWVSYLLHWNVVVYLTMSFSRFRLLLYLSFLSSLIYFDDVMVEDDSVLLRIRRSTMDQCGRAIGYVWLNLQDRPTRAVSMYLRIRPCLSGSFLLHEYGSSLSEIQFSSVLNFFFLS